MLTWACQQELLVDELVAGADAVAREGISELCRTVLGTPPALATFGTLQALGPLRILLAPFPTPFEVLYRYRCASLPPTLQLTPWYKYRSTQLHAYAWHTMCAELRIKLHTAGVAEDSHKSLHD